MPNQSTGLARLRAEQPTPNEPLELPRKRWLARAGVFAGSLVLAASAATAKPNKAESHTFTPGSTAASRPLEYVGVTSNRIWVPNLEEARQAAQDIAATNANTVRIFEPYNPSRVEISSDLPRLCNAAEAARENNLTLEVSFLGYQRDGQNRLRHNYVPSNAGGVSRYLNVVKSVLMDLAGPNANQPGRNDAPPCVQEPLSKLIIEDFDEVNSSGFNSNQNAAKGYAYLESRAIPTLAKVVSDINNSFEGGNPPDSETSPHFELVHVVGALAVGSHDPVGFLRDFDRELKNLGAVPDFILGVHPYPANLAASPADVERAIYGPLRSELDSAWGNDTVPIFYDEFGTPAISTSKRFLYGPRSLSAVAVSEGQQAQYYRDAFVEQSMEEGAVGGLIFQGQDVANDGWPTGIVNPDNSHKGSWNTVAETFYDALNGNLQNNNLP